VPVHLRYETQGPRITLHWEPNPRGDRPVRYEIYGSDEKGFSVHKGEHQVPGRGTVPGNFLGQTSGTSMVVVSPEAADAGANRVFYRVVAVDTGGTASGCSDYIELPHPFVYTEPVREAGVGQAYRYQAASLNGLGDYQCKQDPAANEKRYAYRFWDVDENTFKLVQGAEWLTLDEKTGMLSGEPAASDVGSTTVTLEVSNQFGGSAKQEFPLTVTP
jgi:hypothetical protein